MLYEVITHLERAGLPRATLIAVHGLFAVDAWSRLSARADIVTSESVPHPSNGISLSQALADATRALLAD